jgi:integrase
MGMAFDWMVERGFRTDNPFGHLKKRKEPQKSRTYLTEQERREMVDWIREHDPDFLVPCLFIYATLIRPGELRRLRVYHVDMERQVVTLPAEETKSGAERMPAIPDWMYCELVAAGFNARPGKEWLVGSRLVSGDTPVARNTLNRHWVRMREALGWPATKQLYSLRDTGIIQLLRDGVDLLHVRQQAGHTDIATTNEYLKHAFPNGPAEVRAKSTPLRAMSAFIVLGTITPGSASSSSPTPL